MVSVCMAVHEGKQPFADEASAREHVRKTNERDRDRTATLHTKQRTDKALRTLNAYRCDGCGLWFVGTVKTGPVTPMAELQTTVNRHKKSHAKHRRALAAVKFNGPRVA